MEILAIGIFNKTDYEIIRNIKVKSCHFIDGEDLVLESTEGLKSLSLEYSFYKLGILVYDSKVIDTYPLFLEITDNIIENRGEEAILINYFRTLKESLKNTELVFAFADIWNASTYIRLEYGDMDTLINKINSIHTWGEVYTNFFKNMEERDTSHPLIYRCKF